MLWKEKVIRFNEKKDLEDMINLGYKIEHTLPKISFNNDYQFKKEIKERNEYIYRRILKEYKNG